MNELSNWKSLKSDFTPDEITDSFLAGLLFASLLFLPVFFIIVELITVYMYRLTLLVILIIIAMFCFVYVIHLFWHKSLTLKKKDIKTDIKKLFFKNTLIVNAVVLVLGLIFLFVLIPILWV